MTQNLSTLPTNLPIPQDDGLASHLTGCTMPSVVLQSTSGKLVDVSSIKGWKVVYCYPLTGRPDVNLPSGWDQIPGARGCTPQACAFRDYNQELLTIGVSVYAVSTQTPDYQKEMVDRLHIPFDVLSDAKFDLTNAMHLPTMEVNGIKLLKRLTMIVHDAVVRHIHYPVFPPNAEPLKVIDWLKENQN
jgi:peroxiredoxin